jgi:hypothetical protein
MMPCRIRHTQGFAVLEHAVSKAFLQLYLETTFLADRKTSLAAWEKEHPEVAQEPPLKGK